MPLRVTLFLSLLVSISSNSFAEEKAPLSLARVVLFNAGLGYFEHEAAVTGTATAELKFADGDVNDLLKSLVLQDLGGGKIRTVSLPSRLPLGDRMAEFLFDLSSEPTVGELLHQLRGEEVSVDQEKIVGTILGVEIKTKPVGNQTSSEEILNLLTENGVRSVSLGSITSIKLQNERIDRDLREALKLLASRRESQKTTVQFEFVGDGVRNVRVGYIRQVPIWKTTYRLVVNDAASSVLQGWAIVENTAESDWSSVELTLMSGRPVTFQMDLFQPLLVQRQRLAPKVPSSVASRIYTTALGGLDFANSQYKTEHDARLNASIISAATARARAAAGGGFGGGMGGYGVGGAMGAGGMGMGGAGFSGPGDTGMMPGMSGMAGMQGSRMVAAIESVEAQVSSSDIGEQFQYRVEFPVDLARRRTALIPIVNQEVKVEKLSVFTEGGDTENPMRAMKLTNTTMMKLVQGPVTVFEDGAYAGDAQLDHLPSEESQLFNYAQDIEVRVRTTTTEEKRVASDAKLEQGKLIIHFLKTRQKKYRIENRSDEVRPLVLEQPRDPSWRPARNEQLLETTDAFYRFKVSSPSNETIEYVVDEQHTIMEPHDLGTANMVELEQILALKIADEIKNVVTEIRDLRNQITDSEAALQLDQSALTAIVTEQGRIRANLGALAKDSDLFKTYVAKLTEQEKKFDAIQERIQQHRVQMGKLQQQLHRYILVGGSAKEEDPFK